MNEYQTRRQYVFSQNILLVDQFIGLTLGDFSHQNFRSFSILRTSDTLCFCFSSTLFTQKHIKLVHFFYSIEF
jgi:hypothetical protein